MHDCRDYFAATGRRVTFEYTLMAGVNASQQHVRFSLELQCQPSTLSVLCLWTTPPLTTLCTSPELPDEGNSPLAPFGRDLAALQAEQLAALLRRFDLRSHVNVIPVRRASEDSHPPVFCHCENLAALSCVLAPC